MNEFDRKFNHLKALTEIVMLDLVEKKIPNLQEVEKCVEICEWLEEQDITKEDDSLAEILFKIKFNMTVTREILKMREYLSKVVSSEKNKETKNL